MNTKEPIEEQLDQLYEQIEAKRIAIDSYSGYSKETVLAFESFNHGITTALNMLGAFTGRYRVEKQRAESESREQMKKDAEANQ